MSFQESISKMCIAEIQKTFGLSKISAMRFKQGESVKMDWKKILAFIDKK